MVRGSEFDLWLRVRTGNCMGVGGVELRCKAIPRYWGLQRQMNTVAMAYCQCSGQWLCSDGVTGLRLP